MLTNGMSSNKLLKEYSLDFQYLLEQAANYDKSAKVASILNKSNKAGIAYAYTMVKGNPKTKNKYFCILFYTKEKGGWVWFPVFLGHIVSNNGIYAAAYYMEAKLVIKFSPHFFNRFKSRMLRYGDECLVKTLEMFDKPKDLIPIYAIRNLDMTLMDTGVTYGDNSHFCTPVFDGVVFLNWDKKMAGMVEAKTFVPRNMLSQDQKEMIKNSNHYLECIFSRNKKYKLQHYTGN